MKLTPEQELENAIIKKNYHIVCDLFQLTDKERLHLNAGEWMVDAIKQYQTSAIIHKSIRLRSHENTNVENYNHEDPLPQKNPLDNLADEITGNKENTP